MTKILAVGGGSGGHVTPVVAVFKELRGKGDYELRFWCDKKFNQSAKDIFSKFDNEIEVQIISAGKFRRYHSLSRWYFFAPSIFFPNLLDFFKVVFGFIQSFFKLIAWRPDAIFLKGGFVCLPVGYAARILKIPTVLHDSDTHPGLTNRLLAPSASMIGTGSPLEYYDYPPEKTKYVGVPVAREFREYSDSERKILKHKLGFDKDKPLVVVTGGGLGAVRINNAIISARNTILQEASLMLISGSAHYDELRRDSFSHEDWKLTPFVHENMAEVLGAADVVVARAGATTLLELAALKKPTIIIPNAQLVAGHQLKNAKVYRDSLAAVVLTEDEMDKDPAALAKNILTLLRSPRVREDLGKNFGKFAKPNAASDMAQMIMTVIRRSRRKR